MVTWSRHFGKTAARELRNPKETLRNRKESAMKVIEKNS